MPIRGSLIITPTGILYGRTSVIRSPIITAPRTPDTARGRTIAIIVTTTAIEPSVRLLNYRATNPRFFVTSGNRESGPIRFIIKRGRGAFFMRRCNPWQECACLANEQRRRKCMKKLLLLPLVAIALALVPMKQADAQVSVGIGPVGIGYYGYPGYGYGYYPRSYYSYYGGGYPYYRTYYYSGRPYYGHRYYNKYHKRYYYRY
jgi:hypothetical protein